MRSSRPLVRAPSALTITPAWGITAAPARPGPYGRPGPWAGEAEELERAYGPDRVLHVSLEEFARTLATRAENVERFREGGVRSRGIPRRLARARRAGELDRFAAAFRSFRAFDRPNVLHVFATFRPDPAFAREFPEAVQTGPLWGNAPPVRRRRRPARGRPWVWYASPASAEAIAPEVVEGLARAGAPTLLVRSPRAWGTALGAGRTVRFEQDPLPAAVWRRAFARAAVRIVTGSRSLLDALEVGGPFLYFNGVLGTGPARRRHRPEKIRSFLALARSAGWPADLVRDLSDFSRGRRVVEVVARAARSEGGWRRFPPAPSPAGFRPPFDDAACLVVEVARSLGARTATAPEVVARFRARAHR